MPSISAGFGAGFGDAIIGTGAPGLLAVELEATGEDAETAIHDAARAILAKLPTGAELRALRRAT